MSNLVLATDEVVLYSGKVTSEDLEGNIKVSLTSQRIVLENEQKEVVASVELSEIKWYHDAAQIKQHGSTVEIQSTVGNYTIAFSGMLEARKFVGKAMEAITDTSLTKRVYNKTQKAIDVVDEAFEIDTRGAIKGAIVQGIKGAIKSTLAKKDKTENK